MTERARRRRLVALSAVALATVAALWRWGPPLLREIAWLEVDRIEISGARLTAAGEIVTLAGILEGQHILDDLQPASTAIQGHPNVAEVRVTRRLPSTVRIRIVEKHPVAFVTDSVLVPVTAAGDLLDADPTAVPLDLPIVRGEIRDSSQAPAIRRTLGEIGRMESLDPAFLRSVSEIDPGLQGDGVMIVRHAQADVLIPFGVTLDRLEQLRAVLTDVRVRFPASVPEEAEPLRPVIDLRFSEQVVVRHPSLRELS